MGEYKGYITEEGEVEPGKYGILIYNTEESWKRFEPVDTAWDMADAKRKIDEGKVLGRLFPAPEAPPVEHMVDDIKVIIRYERPGVHHVTIQAPGGRSITEEEGRKITELIEEKTAT